MSKVMIVGRAVGEENYHERTSRNGDADLGGLNFNDSSRRTREQFLW